MIRRRSDSINRDALARALVAVAMPAYETDLEPMVDDYDYTDRVIEIYKRFAADPPLPPSEPPPALRARLPAEDALAMAEVTAMCNARHPGHGRGSKMPQCAWLLYLSSQMTEDQIAAETGIEREKVIADLWHVSDHLSKYLHRMRHNQLKRAGLKCAECITGVAA